MLLDEVKAFLRLSKIGAAFDYQALLEPEKFNVAFSANIFGHQAKS